jgi:putative SOS response-associated peptidase YedK
MNQLITLNATPADYQKLFPGACIAPPGDLRSVTHGGRVQAIYRLGGDTVARDAVWGMSAQRNGYAEPPACYADGCGITRSRRFSRVVRHWRCIVPAMAFTYRSEVDGVALTYTFSVSGGGLLLLGGVLEPNGATTALVTTIPCRMMMPYARQMPFLLAPDQVARWLDLSTDMAAITDLIGPWRDDDLTLTITADNLPNRTSVTDWLASDMQLA